VQLTWADAESPRLDMGCQSVLTKGRGGAERASLPAQVRARRRTCDSLEAGRRFRPGAADIYAVPMGFGEGAAEAARSCSARQGFRRGRPSAVRERLSTPGRSRHDRGATAVHRIEPWIGDRRLSTSRGKFKALL
jgi:hypothetical protein